MISVQVLDANSSSIAAWANDGVGTPLTSTLNAGKQSLDVNITGGSSSGAVADDSLFTPGVSQFVGDGGVFDDSLAALAASQTAVYRMTAYRAMHMNLRNNSGAEVGDAQASGLNVIIGDGTNVPHVLPPSTAAIATDNALVVGMSPNSPLPAGTNLLGSVNVKNAGTAALTQVACNNASTTLVAANANRKGLIIHNQTNKDAYIAFAATATTAAFTYFLKMGNVLELGLNLVYNGLISYIANAAGTGNMVVTDLS